MAIPNGVNTMASKNKNGMTVFGVRIGCHAFNLCWRNAVFGGFLSLWTFEVSDSVRSSSSLFFLLRKKFMAIFKEYVVW